MAMLSRRAFIQSAALAIPLASCRAGNVRDETPIGNLTPNQMEIARKNAAQFENTLETIRKADVPYSVEPRFYRAP
jgi:hypothetical protein